MSIPRGNTVVIAGDPGTGKSTILLTFLRYGTEVDGVVSIGESVPDASRCKVPLMSFDRLVRNLPSKSADSVSNNRYPTLRVFVSLENSFQRILDHHGALLPTKADSVSSGDLYVAIDATSFFSGRLEDMLRYPQLQRSDGDAAARDAGWALYKFVLGGWAPNTDAQSLYWQAPDAEPKAVDQLVSQDRGSPGPFPRDREHSGGGSESNLLLYTLMTPPLPDPMQRVRLLKDLLAALYSRSHEKYKARILGIDSLSALLSLMHEPGVDEQPKQGRRLHILNMVRWLEEHGVTTFMACEAVRDMTQTIRRHPLFLGTQERYIASGVIQLDYHQYSSGDLIRYLRILKMRGAGHDMRSHAYDLDENGLSWLEPLFAEPEDGR